jgi:hypothetical protein
LNGPNGKVVEVRVCLNLHLHEPERGLGVVFNPRPGGVWLEGVFSWCFELLIVRVLLNLLLAKTFGIAMQLRKHALKPVDVDVQDSLKELATYFLKPDFQVRRNTPPLARRPND